MNDRNREAFKEEAYDLLGSLESALLDLENNPESSEIIGSIFRSMHTIKGSGAMFGFDRVASFTHNVENLYDLIRNGKIAVSREIINLTLSACDHIRELIADQGDAPSDDAAETVLADAFRNMLQQTDSLMPVTSAPSAAATSENMPARYRICFRPHQSLCANGTNPLLLLMELRDMGPCTVVAHTDAIPELESIDPESCCTWWDIELTTDKGIDAIRDVFIFVEGDCELEIIPAGESQSVAAAVEQPAARVITAEKIEAGIVEDRRKQTRRKSDLEQGSSLRVSADKLDNLVNMVGELVTVQSRLTSLATEQGQAQLLQVSEEVARLVSELRDLTMSIRMVPIGTILAKYKRLVHDLAAELHKDVALVMNGGDTEMDKTVIEKLNDPLVHLVRNCIDHGIESPEEREALGKPRQGTVTISAIHSGANVLIEIRDDGAGLNADAIRSSALAKGLISPDTDLDEQQLYNLVFQPGFSTARSITNISGRGVGMDVVKQNIEALQGTVNIASEKGAGTVITLKIPLTLVIIDGLLVEIGNDFFVLPLAAIEECVELKRTEAERARGCNLATIRGELVPYIEMRSLLRIEGVRPGIEQIVTAVIDQRRIGFVVDQVIGQHQTVIKSLGRIYRDIEEVSGATILGDGKVALILDLAKLVKKAERMRLGSTVSQRVH